MKSRKIRTVIPLVLLAVAGIGFVANSGLGSVSSFGWRDIAVLCPIGALGSMLASKTVVPRAVVSLVLAVAAIVLLGRAFCAWACPVPVWSKLRDVFKRQDAKAVEARGIERAERRAADATTPLSDDEIRRLRRACGKHHDHHEPSNSRTIVLGAGLLSAAVFGFPVFCLICPVGLSFAGVFTLIMLFGAGDVNWSVIAIPVLLLLEVVLFRKWCSHICPISALMSLVGRLNRTLRPTIDDAKCIETAKGARCGRCAAVCDVGINPRHPELGTSWNECTKCRECADLCPGHAITLPLIARPDKPVQLEGAVAPAKATAGDPAEAD